MQVDELLRYVKWSDNEIRSKGIEDAYNQMIGILARNIQPNQQRQSFQNQRERLQLLLRGVNFGLLNDTQIRFGETIGLGPVVGDQGALSIDEILSRDAADPASIHVKILAMKQRLDAGLQKIASIQAALSELFPVPELDYQEALIHVRFQGNVSIRNVADLEKWADNWYLISRGVTMALNGAPEDIKVTGASRGSLIIDLAGTYSVVLLINQIVHSLAGIAKDYFDLQIQAQELRRSMAENHRMELENAAKIIENEAEKSLSEGKVTILNDLVAELKLVGDAVGSLDKAIDLLQQFRIGGGEIDTVVKEPPKDDSVPGPETKRNLKEIVENIRKTQNETRKLDTAVRRLIEGKSDHS